MKIRRRYDRIKRQEEAAREAWSDHETTRKYEGVGVIESNDQYLLDLYKNMYLLIFQWIV